MKSNITKMHGQQHIKKYAAILLSSVRAVAHCCLTLAKEA